MRAGRCSPHKRLQGERLVAGVAAHDVDLGRSTIVLLDLHIARAARENLVLGGELAAEAGCV